MKIMVIGFDSTSTCSFSTTGTTSNTSTCTGHVKNTGTYWVSSLPQENYDYKKRHELILQEEKEFTKTGWLNPLKTPLPIMVKAKKIRVQIRNKLPRKIC